jgi:enoyl-CoA hydratase/carnithine racemase
VIGWLASAPMSTARPSRTVTSALHASGQSWVQVTRTTRSSVVVAMHASSLVTVVSASAEEYGGRDMGEPLVIREDDGGRATLTLNRPDKLNALTPAVFTELRAHLEHLRTSDVGCIVLAGAGRAFCAGNDLDKIGAGEGGDPMLGPETIDLLEAMPQATICRIHGYCFTGALELALGCDFLFAAESAQIGDTHGQWGLAPIWGMTVRLPERIGRSRAKELMFTARRIKGSEAAAIGLVDRAVPADDLDAAVDGLVAEILACSRGTVRIEKAIMADATTMSRAQALLHERSRPHGLPEDMGDRLRAGGRR